EFFERALEAQILDVNLSVFGHMLIPDAASYSDLTGLSGWIIRRISPAHQRSDVGCDRFFQAHQIIAALEHRYNSPARAVIGDIHQFARDPAEIFRLEVER